MLASAPPHPAPLTTTHRLPPEHKPAQERNWRRAAAASPRVALLRKWLSKHTPPYGRAVQQPASRTWTRSCPSAWRGVQCNRAVRQNDRWLWRANTLSFNRIPFDNEQVEPIEVHSIVGLDLYHSGSLWDLIKRRQVGDRQGPITR